MLVGRFSGPMRVTSLPAISIEPVVGSAKPPMMRKRVVLPHPDGPRMARKSPAAMSRSSGCTATTLAKLLLTPRSLTSIGSESRFGQDLAAVQYDRRAGDVARGIRGEKRHGLADLFGLSEPAERRSTRHHYQVFGTALALQIGGFDIAGLDDVAGYPVRRTFKRHRPGKSDEA